MEVRICCTLVEETKCYAIILDVLIWLVGFMVLSATFNIMSDISVTITYTDQKKYEIYRRNCNERMEYFYIFHSCR